MAGEVNVTPAQRQKLPQSQTGICGNPHHLGVLAILGSFLLRLGYCRWRWVAMATLRQGACERLDLLRAVERQRAGLRFGSWVPPELQ